MLINPHPFGRRCDLDECGVDIIPTICISTLWDGRERELTICTIIKCVRGRVLIMFRI